MTDAENLEKVIRDFFGAERRIRSGSTNKCAAPLNRPSKNLFAYNFLNRLARLSGRFSGREGEAAEICDRLKNIGEAGEHQWAGPYSELVALDFYSQFSEFFGLSYVNVLPVPLHRGSIPARNGHSEKIDIDLCLNMRGQKIYTDVKSFNCVHLQILDGIFREVEEFAKESLGKGVLLGVDNLSEIDYREVKNNLGARMPEIRERLKEAVRNGERVVDYTSVEGMRFSFKVGYLNQGHFLSTVREYSPFAMAESYKYKFLDYGNKLLDDEYSMITIVRNPWFNEETVDFGDFNNIFYRALSRRTFMELSRMECPARSCSRNYTNDSVSVSEVSRSLSGIVFIDDHSPSAKSQSELYSAYIYLNPNYSCLDPAKRPLTTRMLERYFRNAFECQIKDFDDFRFDNY